LSRPSGWSTSARYAIGAGSDRDRCPVRHCRRSFDQRPDLALPIESTPPRDRGSRACAGRRPDLDSGHNAPSATTKRHLFLPTSSTSGGTCMQLWPREIRSRPSCSSTPRGATFSSSPLTRSCVTWSRTSGPRASRSGSYFREAKPSKQSAALEMSSDQQRLSPFQPFPTQLRRIWTSWTARPTRPTVKSPTKSETPGSRVLMLWMDRLPPDPPVMPQAGYSTNRERITPHGDTNRLGL
jgi:hypothetical protein